jgi:hypothetical protein
MTQATQLLALYGRQAVTSATVASSLSHPTANRSFGQVQLSAHFADRLATGVHVGPKWPVVSGESDYLFRSKVTGQLGGK